MLKLYIKDFWRYRYLLQNLISRDFKLKYRRSVLGVAWSVLNPLMMCLVMWAVFSSIFNTRGAGIENFAVFLLIAYFKNGGTRFQYSLKKAKELLQSSSSFIIAGLMVSIYACTDKLMLKQMLGADAVGHYSLASTVSVSWAFILSAIIDSLYPEIVQSFQKDRLRYERKNRQLYAIVFYVSLFVSAMICLVAKPFILILYGKTYLPAVGPLRIVVWYTAFSYLGVARNAWMVCENRQKYLKYLYVSAAALNVVLNLALIPSWGASGAAAASLITQASTTILLPALIRPLRPNTKLMLDAVLLRGVLPEKQRNHTKE